MIFNKFKEGKYTLMTLYESLLPFTFHLKIWFKEVIVTIIILFRNINKVIKITKRSNNPSNGNEMRSRKKKEN